MYSNRLHTKHLTHFPKKLTSKKYPRLSMRQMFLWRNKREGGAGEADRCSNRIRLHSLGSTRYTQILQIIAVVLMTFGLIGKVFNCIIFLRKPVRRPFLVGIATFIEGCFSFVEHRRACCCSWKLSSTPFLCFGHSSSIRSFSFAMNKSMLRASSVLFRVRVNCSCPGQLVSLFSPVRFVWRRSCTRDICLNRHVFASLLSFYWWWSVASCLIGIFSTIQVLYKVSYSMIRIGHSPIATCSSVVKWAISLSVVFSRHKNFSTMRRLLISSFRHWFHLRLSPRRTLWLSFVS